VLPFEFGFDGALVIEGLTNVLGAPSLDEQHEYPNPDGRGGYLDDDLMVFGYPYGRTVCWSDGELCVELGSEIPDDLRFVGWRQYQPSDISTSSGVSVGTQQSDHPDGFELTEGGCYYEGYGLVEGIRVTVHSDGVPFLEIVEEVDEDGSIRYTPVFRVPDPSDVVVRQLNTGQVPWYSENDC
jgi:hypothetical protein